MDRILLFVFFLVAVCCKCEAQNHDDVKALLSFKNRVDLNNTLSDWNTQNSSLMCKWRGITCYNSSRRVQAINFYRYSYYDSDYYISLYGALGGEFCKCIGLQHLTIAGFFLDGPIDACFGSLSTLIHLDLSRNKLSGDIPTELGNFSALQYLDLRSNKLSGHIPREVGNYSALQHLDLSFNNLSGDIPMELGNCSALIILGLNNNFFTDNIPRELGNCRALRVLDLSNNTLIGDIPNELANLSSLIGLYLSNNRLIGLPKELANLSSLIILDLSNNTLAGNIPGFISQSLTYVYLHNNELIGRIPIELGNRPYLSHLSLYNNKLSEIPSDFNVWNIRVIQIQNNSFVGRIPSLGFGNKTPRFIDFSSNKFSGPLPELCNLEGIIYLNLAYNNLEGTIPHCLGTLRRIVVLDLSNNNLTGSLPGDFRELGLLRNESFWNDTVIMYYGQKKVGGSMRWKGTISVLYDIITSRRTSFDVSKNRLNGSIPWQFGDLRLLRQLDLSHNDFSGEIPRQLGNATALDSLDLSWNNLNGTIPSELCRIDGLGVFTVSHNNLSGSIPIGHCDTFPASSFEGNPQLCGQPLSACNTTPNPNSTAPKAADGLERETQDWNSWLKEYVGNPGFFVGTCIGLILGIICILKV